MYQFFWRIYVMTNINTTDYMQIRIIMHDLLKFIASLIKAQKVTRIKILFV